MTNQTYRIQAEQDEAPLLGRRVRLQSEYVMEAMDPEMYTGQQGKRMKKR